MSYIKLPKGTRDYCNEDYYKLQFMKNILENIFIKFNVEPLITPVFERRDLLNSKYGEEEKLIFNLENPNTLIESNKEMTSLRYDMTIPLVRHILMNNINKMKRYTIGKVYRRETISSKSKRLREFNQADFDFVGIYDKFLPEIQIFKMINLFFSELNITNYKIRYNFRELLYYYIVDQANIDNKLFKPFKI